MTIETVVFDIGGVLEIKLGRAGASSRPHVSSRARRSGAGVQDHLVIDDVGEPTLEAAYWHLVVSSRRRLCGLSTRGHRCRGGAAGPRK
jgi:hypothetical protein